MWAFFFKDPAASTEDISKRHLNEKDLPFVGWTYRRFELKNRVAVQGLFDGESPTKEEKENKISPATSGKAKKKKKEKPTGK